MNGLPPVQYWLSFADPHRPKGQQFLGVAIVAVAAQPLDQRLEVVDALSTAGVLGCNPGGEVQCVRIPREKALPADILGILHQRADLERLGLLP